MDRASHKGGQNKVEFTAYAMGIYATTKNIQITQLRAMLIKVSCGLFFYMLWLTSYRVHPFDRMHLGMGCRFSPRFVPSVNLNETKGDNYER